MRSHLAVTNFFCSFFCFLDFPRVHQSETLLYTCYSFRGRVKYLFQFQFKILLTNTKYNESMTSLRYLVEPMIPFSLRKSYFS